ncbi:MAG: Carboxylate-amine ligase YbdK [Betaproteobacteria bacterium ADurb.Bin341]|nr:MAG: Carboxylate-amine ligase YbdK [Betaproteobacteria bacterium ADurb.Bin341]
MTPLTSEFKHSRPLTLGVELELQLLSQRDFDLTRAATDLLGSMHYDGRFGEIKLEITESMIEVSTLPRATVDGIASDLDGLRQTLLAQCARNNIALCGGGTHPFHHWPDRRICPGQRFDELYSRYGYLAKQFTVFGQHIHVGCTSADEAIWLTQALAPYVPVFIALSASSPYVDGVDTLFQSARLNAVSAFPLSGQCPELRDWAHFVEHFHFLQDCGIANSIKDLYWDIRPKPEYGTVEIRVCDTPLTIERAAALAALAQSLSHHLLRTRPAINTGLHLYVARYNKFQACRYGFAAHISDPLQRKPVEMKELLRELFEQLGEDARELGCSAWLDLLKVSLEAELNDARWLREQQAKHKNLNDVTHAAALLFASGTTTESGENKQ